MTQPPYTDAPLADEAFPQRPRVSGLAVASLVFGLLCCIPGSGLIGVILGGAGLIRIGRSEGRLTGRGMALIGLVLGLLGTLLYLGLTIGLMASLNALNTYGDVARALDKGDHSAVRAMLSPSTSGALSDEQIDRFAQRIRDEWGGYQGLPKGLPEWVRDYIAIMPTLEKGGLRTGDLGLPLLYDRGRPAAIYRIDRASTGPSGASTVSELGVAARDGTMIWLLDAKSGSTPPGPVPLH
jgi:hypothetical protein